MALYIGEEEVWKCPKHPSKRRRSITGICPTCLRERLGILCPDCATIRPCACFTSATSSSSSSFSLLSSFSSSARKTAPHDDSPKFLRSRSVAVPFMRSRFSANVSENTVKTKSFWSNFKSNNKSRKGETERRKDGDEEWKDDAQIQNLYYDSKIGEFEKMMVKSRSMRAPITTEIDGGHAKSSSWHFPSPIKLFRHRSKVVNYI